MDIDNFKSRGASALKKTILSEDTHFLCESMAQYQCSVIFQLILMYTNYFLEMTYLCGYQKADNHQSKRSKLFHLNFLCKLWKQFMLPPFLMVLFFKHQISRKWNQPALRVKIGVFDIPFILGQRGALSSNPKTLSIFQGGKEFCWLFHEFFLYVETLSSFF